MINQPADSWNLSIKFLNFKKTYGSLRDFTLMQAFNLLPLSDKELEKLVLKTPVLQKVSF